MPGIDSSWISWGHTAEGAPPPVDRRRPRSTGAHPAPGDAHVVVAAEPPVAAQGAATLATIDATPPAVLRSAPTLVDHWAWPAT